MKENFNAEAARRFPEKLVQNSEVIEKWIERGAKAGEMIVEIARLGNPDWQKDVESIKPPLIYGTVDGAGNVAELLVMQSMADKLGVPMVLFLDDVAYNVGSSHERLTKPSLSLLGMNEKNLGENADKKLDEVKVKAVLPDELVKMVEGLGVDWDGVSMAQAYREMLYLVAVEVMGESVLDRLSIVPASELMRQTQVGQVPLSQLSGMLQKMARMANKRDGLVFLHDKDFEKIRSGGRVEGTVAEWYKFGGWLGGSAWVALTAMMVNSKHFAGAGPLVLAEKDTALGRNFATAYEVVLEGLDSDAAKIAVTGVKRIKVDKSQNGGDGVDPAVFWVWLKTSKWAGVAKKMLSGMMESAFPAEDGVSGELELANTERMLVEVRKILKSEWGVDGKFLMDKGFKGREIGEMLEILTMRFVDGEISSFDEAEMIINQKLKQ